jgi:hypothetical protein
VLADDWTATRLRGVVLIADAAGGTQWVHLNRGDVVSDARAIRTMASGNVEFTRGAETVAVGPNTEAEIVDRTGRRYTTVVQQFGTVSIAAEARNVQHFAVETPYLVAVVKGTMFTVTTDPRGSRVAVARGLVAVTDLLSHLTTLVPAGEALAAAPTGTVTMSGRAQPGLIHPVVNGVVEDEDGGAGSADNAGSTDGSFAAQLAAALGTTTDDVLGTAGTTVDGAGRTVGGLLGNTVGGAGALAGGILGSAGDTLGSLAGGNDGVVGTTVGTAGAALGDTGGLVTVTTGDLGSTLGGTVGSTAGVVGSTVGAAGGLVGNTVGAAGGVLHHLGL